ncbi:MAG: hypothetical protein IMZ66_10365, partial [Planctomycetes bacterium]|nr:hypothetical protein [Planctomycetota bacterium]
MRILLLLLCAATAGCTGFTKPFMGVPEYKTVHYEDDDPQTIFRGVPKLTAVHQTEYRNFLLAMREGRIVAQERRGTTMYFAVAVPRCVQFEDAPPDAARGAYVIVTERYKAKMPEAPPKILPKDDLRPPSSLQPKPPKPKTL